MAAEGVQQLSVSVLGSVRVTRDGRARPVTSRRQRTLLAALAIQHPRSVSVDDLIEAVWEEDPPERAPTTLQTYVSRLRAVLGEDAIVHDSSGYRLARDATVDAQQARDALVRGQSLLQTEPALAAETARGALDAWDGTSLAEVADRPWFRPVAVGLDELRDNLRDTAAEGLVTSGRAVEAVDILETLVSTHPFREPAQVLLVRALAEAGRPAEALRAADRYRSRLRDETGLDPGPGLAVVEGAVLTGELAHLGRPPLPLAASAPAGIPARGGLPRPSRLIGRGEDLAELLGRVDQARLVTVLGTGGVGKTRLVAELLAERRDTDAPVVVVELAPVSPRDVIDTVAAAMGYRAGRADLGTLVEVLGSDRALLVLDNCEHVVAEARSVVRAVLDACPGASFVTTSRVRLALPDEQVLALQPLETAGDRPPSVDLFAECLQRSHPRTDIDVTGDDVRRLCQMLDGIPLALELAAGRAALLGVGPLTERLAASVELLASPHEAGGDRHASLHALVAWSHDLLGPSARRLLALLSTFESEFDLDAAEMVAGPVLDDPVAPTFGRLIDTCMVALGSATGRFRLLDMVRQFSLAQLAAGGDEAEARRAHARWVADQVGSISTDATGAAESTVTDRMDAVRPDIRSAVAWARDSGDVASLAAIAGGLAQPLLYRPDAELATLVLSAANRPANRGADGEATLAAAGARCACLLGALDEAQQLAARALSLVPQGTEGAPARHRASHAHGMLALYRGEFEPAAKAFGAVSADPDASKVDRLDALAGVALATTYDGDLGAATEHATRHRALAEAAGSDTAIAFADYIDAERALAAGDPVAALASLEAGADRAWSVGATFVWGLASTVLAATLVRQHDHAGAARRLPDLLRRWRRTSTWPQLWTSLRLVAEVLGAHGDDANAAMLLAAADRDPSALAPQGADQERADTLRRALRTRLGTRELALAEARAQELDRGQVLEVAIDALESLPDPDPDA